MPGLGRQKAWGRPKYLGDRWTELAVGGRSPLSLLSPRALQGHHARTAQVPPRHQRPPPSEALLPMASGASLSTEDHGHAEPAALQHLPAPHTRAGQDSSGNVSIKFRPHPIESSGLVLPSFLLESQSSAHPPSLDLWPPLGHSPGGLHCPPSLPLLSSHLIPILERHLPLQGHLPVSGRSDHEGPHTSGWETGQ